MKKSPNSAVRKELLRLQQESFLHLVGEISTMQGEEAPPLRKYRSRYEKEVSTFRRMSDKAALIHAVEGADVVYVGDYHTLRQAQKTVVRILTPLVESKRRVAIGMEMLFKNAERAANDFVRGKTDEKRFLEKIDYENRWGFPWANYRQIFEFAREHKIPLVGLSSNFSDRLPLEARDDLAADFIVESTLAEPDRLLLCLYGDLHMADVHIPRRVRMRLDRYGIKRKCVTVLQNSESIYWKLAQKNLENTVDVVEISKNRFCVLSAAPWVKLQSYRTWLEDHSGLMEEGAETDYYHQVLDLAKRISGFLDLSPPALEHFSVMTAEDADVIAEIAKYTSKLERSSPFLKRLLHAELVEGQSCFLPEKSILYLSDLSENKGAEKAAQIVAAKMDPKREGSMYVVAAQRKEIFYRLVLWEAIGFFGSKIVNPKRKCDQYLDFRELLRKKTKRPEMEVARVLLAHRNFELKKLRNKEGARFPKKILHLQADKFFLVGRKLGKILGHRIYSAMVHERISKDTIRELFSPLGSEDRVAKHRYWKLIRLSQKHDPKDRESKEDRF